MKNFTLHSQNKFLSVILAALLLSLVLPQSAFAAGDSPLVAAAKAKDTIKINKLIKSGEDVNAKDKDGETGNPVKTYQKID